MAWPTFLIRRLVQLAFLLLGIATLTFFISHALPADPVVANLGQRAADNPHIVSAFRQKWGLDQPLPMQYAHYLRNLLGGELGQSLSTHRPVGQDLAQYFPATVELASAALLLSLLWGLPLGVLSAVHKDRWPDHLLRLVSLVGVSAPVFWLGVIMLDLFYFRLRWLPGPGRLSIGVAAPAGPTGLLLVDSALTGQWTVLGDALAHLFLPALVLASYLTGLVLRVTRAEVLEVLGRDFVRTARSKGIPEGVVVRRHVLKNALGAPVTVIGLAYGRLLSGAVLTETIFAWPGLGRYAFHAATKLDFPAIVGSALVIALCYGVVNLIVDVVYALLDPRTRTSLSL